MTSTVLYDACVLYPAPLRDLLMRLAETGIVKARWSNDILDETFRSIRDDRPDIPEARLARTRELMCVAIDDCLVTGYEGLADDLELPDPGMGEASHSRRDTLRLSHVS